MDMFTTSEQFDIVISGMFSEKQNWGSMVAVIAIVLAKLGLLWFGAKDKSSLYKFSICEYDVNFIGKSEFN